MSFVDHIFMYWYLLSDVTYRMPTLPFVEFSTLNLSVIK